MPDSHPIYALRGSRLTLLCSLFVAVVWQSTLPTATYAQSDLSVGDLVRLDTPTMAMMLDFQNRQGDKQLILLDQADSQAGHPTLKVGAQMRGSVLAAHTSRANQFPYLGRFPTDFTGTTATDARMLQANLGFVGQFSPWATGYVELLFSDVFTFADHKQGSFQVRQAYAVLGNLERSPFYAFIGKKNVSFGDLGTLSPFTQAVPWHYFAPLAEGVGGGYFQDGLHLVATALNGSRGIRVSDSPEMGKLNNFALNGSYTMDVASDITATLGGGFLYGTIYDGQVAEHLDASVTGAENGAWDVNGQIHYGTFTLAAEFVQTLKAWPVTSEQVTAYRVEGAKSFNYQYPVWFTGSWSEGIQGQPDDEFEYNRQLVVGLAA